MQPLVEKMGTITRDTQLTPEGQRARLAALAKSAEARNATDHLEKVQQEQAAVVVDIRSERGHESLSASKVLTTATHPPNKDTVFGE